MDSVELLTKMGKKEIETMSEGEYFLAASELSLLRNQIRTVKDIKSAELEEVRAELEEYKKEFVSVSLKNEKLLIAFHDAINRNKGTVPTSGEMFYHPLYISKN